jgi:transposase
VVLIGLGHAHDSPMFDPLMGQLRVPVWAPAGRALDWQRCWAIRPTRRAHTGHVRAVIPEQSTQIDHRRRRGSRGGRPAGFDAQKYKRRNVIEGSFNIVKNWRGLATRYDKLALTYRAAAVLAAICTWLRHLKDTP